MTKEESDLIIAEQNKSTEEILKAVAKVKSDYHELCKLKDMRIAELEEKISILLSCKNCPENKGGFICQKEYEDKCLAQKIQFIKELKEEKVKLEQLIKTQDRKLRQQSKVCDEAINRVEILANENAESKCECRTCVYTDSPCVRSDYSSKDGVCSHYKNVFDENAELKEENKVLAQNLEDTEIINKTYEKKNEELKKQLTELKEFYEIEYFQIADRTADEKIKELEKHQEEVTIDDYSPYNENTWGMMHEEWFVPKEEVRDLLKENYALITKSKELLKQWLQTSKASGCNNINIVTDTEQFLKDLEK